MTKSEIRALVASHRVFSRNELDPLEYFYIPATLLSDALHRKMVEGRVEELKELYQWARMESGLTQTHIDNRIAELRRELELES